MKEDFRGAVVRLREGRVTFNEFERATRPRWEALAGWLMRRWRLPGWVEQRDIVQDLLLGAWRAVWTFEPDRGSMPIERYVRVEAVNQAQKRIHKLRGANLHTYRGGHIDLPFGQMSEEAEAAMEAMTAVPAPQEGDVAWAESTARASRACESMAELLVVQALARTESLRGGAAIMYGDQDARDLLGLESEEHAVRVVVRAACALAERLENQAA